MAIKPLGIKAYGSIGHLIGSRLGPGDWSLNEGQTRILTEKPRKGDRIQVSEKVDGSCMAAAKLNGTILALSKAGYLASDSPYEHLRRFVPWVADRESQFDSLLNEGERVAGEWLGMAVGTIYDNTDSRFSPFVIFDIVRENKRILFDEFSDRIAFSRFVRANTIHDSDQGCSIALAMAKIGQFGSHGALEPAEGAVWRVEREGRVDFLGKYVRHDKVDGKYLTNLSGGEPIWLI